LFLEAFVNARVQASSGHSNVQMLCDGLSGSCFGLCVLNRVGQRTLICNPNSNP
jgi:hypothetical protein